MEKEEQIFTNDTYAIVEESAKVRYMYIYVRICCLLFFSPLRHISGHFGRGQLTYTCIRTVPGQVSNAVYPV